jgi:hypothetical protein
MNRLCFISLLLVFVYAGNSAFAQKYKPYIDIESTNGLAKIVYQNQKISFKDSQGNIVSGKIYIYNDSQFCFINFFNEAESDTIHIKDIYSVYLKSNQARKVPLIIPILGVIIMPLVAIPVIAIAYLVKHNKKGKLNNPNARSGWYNKDEFKVSIKDLYEEA